jgi:hypothetical protein
MRNAPCVCCHLSPRSRGLLCSECATFSCPTHGWSPIACGGKIVCEECHDAAGCPMGDEDGCCASCGLTVDCQRGAANGLCGSCATSTVMGGA